MGKIQRLPDAVANQIAAGEVVERPVAVVKELVENALDAGATEIEVDFRQGGKSLIEVRDNGSGMERADALLSVERHATSKIRTAADLDHISSFGFRGEALPSIASVSHFTLRTRAESEPVGTEIVINGGARPEVRDSGVPRGTRIAVARLFNSVPARRKFLKTDRTEGAHIVQLCRLLAVAHPQVSFLLVEDGHTVFRSPACADLRDRVREIFGRELVRNLESIDAEEDGLRLYGLIGRPSFGRSTRGDLNTYINRRPVRSRVLDYALIESYHTYLPRGRYPVSFLFLDIDPAAVDVNVHPAKREVRFRDEADIRRFVMEALIARLRQLSRAALPNARAVEVVDALDAPPVPSASAMPIPSPAPHVRPIVAPVAPPTPATSAPITHGAPATSTRRPPFSPPAVPAPAPAASAPPSGRRMDWRLMGIHAGRYAVFEAPDGLVCVHLAAAWERVCYENILFSLSARQLARQSLLFPISLELDPLLASVLAQHLGFFHDAGFDIEPFGRNFFRLRAVPDWFSPEEAEAFVVDLLGMIRERGLRPDAGEAALRTVAELAARRAARGRPPPDARQAGTLLEQLFASEHPLADPRGRPTLFELPTRELDQKFGIQAPAADPD